MAPKRKSAPTTSAKVIDVSKLNKGDILSCHNYYVVDKTEDGAIHVHDMTGTNIRIGISIVERECLSSEQYTSEKRVTRTELSHVIQNIGHAAFRVTFRKQPTADNISDGLQAEDTSTAAKRLRVVKQLMEGEERVLHGRLHRNKEQDINVEFGRIRVIDLAIAGAASSEQSAFRLVDTRSINELIVEGVRYYV